MGFQKRVAAADVDLVQRQRSDHFMWSNLARTRLSQWSRLHPCAWHTLPLRDASTTNFVGRTMLLRPRPTQACFGYATKWPSLHQDSPIDRSIWFLPLRHPNWSLPQANYHLQHWKTALILAETLAIRSWWTRKDGEVIHTESDWFRLRQPSFIALCD